ncbi:MAG TPA: hypothetical protein VMR65_03845 [Candidatus Sulfotelmatobacter sp.]|nr:hypothetical protein [Candidatus Sulfotelmatobacter sp.]
MAINFEVKKKITVDGKEYESLDQVPAEVRGAIRNAVEVGGTALSGKITINGKTYASVQEMPAPLRAIVRGLTLMALNREDAATRSGPEPVAASLPAGDGPRPEPILSLKTVVFALGVAALLFLIARALF